MNSTVDKPKQSSNRIKRSVNGIFLLDKATGYSSNAALQKVKRLFQARKAGHSGSLDPLASGLLPICLGEATKFSQFLLDSDKTYIVTARLGVRTDSSDAEGQVISEKPVPELSAEIIDAQLEHFRGQVSQVPSMFSALKVNGQPLYRLARQGIEIERPSRQIHIYKLELLNLTADSLSLHVHCSKGTYVRTLVDDLGERLGCGAHVIELRRTTVGPYGEAQMIGFDQLEAIFETQSLAGLDSKLLPLDSIITQWPSLTLNDATAYYLRQGQAVLVPHAPTSGWVQLKNKAGLFLGIGEIHEDGRVAPRRLTAEFERQAS